MSSCRQPKNIMSKKKRDIPQFQTPIIETHCHLDYLDVEQLAGILKKSFEVGIERIVTIAVSPDNLEKVMALTRESSAIWGTQGIHPHEANHYNTDVEEMIRANAQNPRILAIGEIGLDYYYDHVDRSIQRSAFERQLELAAELDLPVVIHSRDADKDTQDILQSYSGRLPRKGVIHSFTSSRALAEYCLSEGFFLVFNGITTFNKADNVREVVSITPVEQLILETDAPYLTPVPYRGKPNAPYYLPFIAEKIAQVKDIAVEELLQRAYDNSLSLFFR
jgi:TatD DNase family protein